MNEISTAQIVSAASKATSEVFQTMLGLELHIGEPREESVNLPQVDGVVALVGIGGTWMGSGRISCSSQMACRLAGAMLMSDFEYVNEDVLDAMSEIANMIIGNMKTTFEEQLGTLALSIPTVVFGRNYKTRCAGVRQWTRIPVNSGGEVMDVCFFLVKSQTTQPGVAETEESYA